MATRRATGVLMVYIILLIILKSFHGLKAHSCARIAPADEVQSFYGGRLAEAVYYKVFIRQRHMKPIVAKNSLDLTPRQSILIMLKYLRLVLVVELNIGLYFIPEYHSTLMLMFDIEINPGPSDYFVGTANKNINNVKLAHLNVRSLKCREHFILTKETVIRNKFDVFTISESWLDSKISDHEIEIPGYQLYRVDRPNKKGGGVCAYVLQNYRVELLSNISNVSVLGFHQLWLKIQVRNLRSFLVCAVYRPPDTPLTFFDNDLSASLITALSFDKPVYIMGDLNCNLLNHERPDSKALDNFCRSFNLKQMIETATRVTNASESLLDVLIVSNPQQVLKTKVLQSSISDHDLVYAVLRLKNARPKATYVLTRSFRLYDSIAFLKDLYGVPWSILSVFDDAEDKLYAFSTLFNEILDNHAPVRTIKVRGRRNPCITEDIRELMKLRDSWRREARKNNDEEAWAMYKNLRNRVKSEIRSAEREFVNEQIQNKNNSNCIWKAIRFCIPKKSATRREFSKDERVAANEFNEFFVSVGQRTVDKIKSLASECDFIMDNSSFVPRQYDGQDQFAFSSVHCSEVEDIIKAMPSNKAPGFDKVPIRVVKDSLPATLPFITAIINASFKSSVFPNIWKTAEVIPILKQGNHEEANNNRPISLLPALSKVCERVAHNQFTSYLTLNERLTAKQSGNRKWHSTETTLINTTDKILEEIDNKKLSAFVYLDLSKAFDSLNHQILLSKLQDVGVSSDALKWFQTYITNRKQVVRINSVTSEVLPINHGVPQGSILGPLLFTIYVNDLPMVAKNCSTECFVDDTKLYASFCLCDHAQTADKMNQDLVRVRDWSFNNQLLLNPEKTKLMVFGSRQMRSKLLEFRLSLLGKDILPASTVTDMGVGFDSELSFDDHIIKTVSTCMSRLGQINRVKHAFDKKTLIMVINTLVFSKLFYCSNVWCNTSEKNLRKLQCVQNFACRVVCDARKFDHVTPLLRELRWLPVKDKLYYRLAVMTFKCLTGCAPKYLASQFIKRGNVSKRNTRSSQLLNIPLCRTATGQRSFYYRSVTLWNNLDNSLKLSSSLDIFKRHLRNSLLDNFLGL